MPSWTVGVDVAATWTKGAGVGLVGLAACTIANPIYDAPAGASGPTTTDASGMSSTPLPTDDPVVDTGAVESTTGTTSGIGPDETSVTGETPTTGDTGPEEPPPEVGPFGPPVSLPFNDPLSEDDDPTLTEDMLELYFASQRLGGLGNDDIWVTRRDSLDAEWEAPELVVELSTFARDNTPEVSLDGRVMMLASTRGGLLDEDVFVSTRADRSVPWPEPTPVTELNTAVRDVCPFATADVSRVYVCTGSFLTLDLVRFEKGAGGWSEPTPIVELNTPELDCGAWLDASERVIAFMSDRPGGAGATDLYVAYRPTVDEPFGVPERIGGINSPWWDDDPWISQDGGVVYFKSDRAGVGDLYVAYRVQ